MDDRHIFYFCNGCFRPADKFDIAIVKIARIALIIWMLLMIALFMALAVVIFVII